MSRERDKAQPLLGGDGIGISTGVHSLQGVRPHMEDRHTILTGSAFHEDCKIQDDEVSRSFFAVYDGHGGHVCAEYSRRHLHRNLANEHDFYTDPAKALRGAVLTTEHNFLSAARNLNLESSSGTCAIIAFVEGSRLFIANVGDSRAVLCAGGSAVELSKDHKPTRRDEWSRIRKNGGYVAHSEAQAESSNQFLLQCARFCCPCTSSGAMRVYPGGLAISRSIGDLACKNGENLVIADPEITQRDLKLKRDEFLILACDGVWDVLSSQEAVNVVRGELSRHKTPTEAAIKLARTAYNSGSTDNISVIVIKFHSDSES